MNPAKRTKTFYRRKTDRTTLEEVRERRPKQKEIANRIVNDYPSLKGTAFPMRIARIEKSPQLSQREMFVATLRVCAEAVYALKTPAETKRMLEFIKVQAENALWAQEDSKFAVRRKKA